MQLPASLKSFERPARRWLQLGAAKQIEFSGATYQVQVVDPESQDEAWAFLQLDSQGHLSDGFCSGENCDAASGCIHLAVAYLRIFNGHLHPLHQRFAHSIWNALCRLYADRLGYDSSLLKRDSKGRYACYSLGRKCLFAIQASTPESLTQLKEILEKKSLETEETSLKFSNLSPEELILWREGRPTPELAYELSFWNDLAKWLMLMQDSGSEYQVQFGYSNRGLPNQFKVSFPAVEVDCYLSEANLPQIIPALKNIKSPLQIHDEWQESIQKMYYNQKEGVIHLVKNRGSADITDFNLLKKEGIRCENWLFVPGQGFFANDPQQLIHGSVISGNAIPQLLSEHMMLVKRHLEGCSFNTEPIKPSYKLFFDANWNLHVLTYLFEPGDLTHPYSKLYYPWAYLADDGFYQLDEMRFDHAEEIISPELVPDFVNRHRSWLNSQEGFHTHVSGFESELFYKVDERRILRFDRASLPLETEGKSRDFGAWIFVIGEGFYAKTNRHYGPIHAGLAIPPDQIPLFLRMNREELQLIPRFFSRQNPVYKAALELNAIRNDQIEITPHYHLFPGYQQDQVQFFEEFSYVPGEGFYELPADLRLPEKFRQTTKLQGEALDLFIEYEFEGLKRYVESWKGPFISPKSLKLMSQASQLPAEADGGYVLQLYFHSELGEISLADVETAIRNKRQWICSPAGLINLREERFNWIRSLGKNRINRKTNEVYFTTLELIRLNAFEELHFNSGAKTSQDLLGQLLEKDVPAMGPLTGLRSLLRPYQRLGVEWLWHLYHHHLSGLLCDDMGLGKTHQAMALLAAVRDFQKQSEGIPLQFLIVCPTSVLFHWEEKLQDFLPNAKVFTFYGTKRSFEEFNSFHHILLTSYGIWRNEKELLSKIPFEIAIFDEIQLAKNHNSRIHAALQQVQARMRIGLTGTPIENHLRELKALFDLVLPTYMPSETDYRDFFIRPIEKEFNDERRELLSRFVKPFVLRRKKEDVLLDLPEKIEEVSHCPLSQQQRHYYNEAIQRSKQTVVANLQNESVPVSYIHLFSLLSQLKQICDHPALFLKDVPNAANYHSGKWDLFVELLQEARQSGQKVVVFSQYLGMLDIIENYLNQEGIDFAGIRGATVKRGDEVRRFNHDPACEVFVASLQAAGVGIDLTAASVVIHYDRWWNAAKENQATDRVHRIGQTRGVQVFKLVTRGTFEEKIDQLIQKKGRLMEEVIGIDDHLLLKQFNRSELLQLIQEVEAVPMDDSVNDQ